VLGLSTRPPPPDCWLLQMFIVFLVKTKVNSDKYLEILYIGTVSLMTRTNKEAKTQKGGGEFRPETAGLDTRSNPAGPRRAFLGARKYHTGPTTFRTHTGQKKMNYVGFQCTSFSGSGHILYAPYVQSFGDVTTPGRLGLFY
jgi:hypothetical protein